MKVPSIRHYILPTVFLVYTTLIMPTWAANPDRDSTVPMTPPQPTLPDTISPEAKAILSQILLAQPTQGVDLTTAQQRAFADAMQDQMSKVQLAQYDVQVESAVIAGIPVRIFTPGNPADADSRNVLLNVHGGGFVLDSGSMTENIPVAALTGTKVISVLYRLAPEHPFPAAVEDTVAVYKELLKSYSAGNIILYGTSAGAILSAETIAALIELKLPLPAAMGFFSASADMSRTGDSEQYLPKLNGKTSIEVIAPYTGQTELTDPLISPLYSELKRFPPTLLIAGTRDPFLSQTSIFHRALLAAGVPAELVVFEAMPHAHWSYLDIPESREAFEIMARFFSQHFPR